ncbi:hypothetical protein [Aedoeadaptatus urinae]|uniref:YfjL-like protein n=1 Tax=Aedoeadaptatus urinae TaxID=1871017 RepID=UPI00097D5EAA|nr:hypothetical protein [Peptoniphilus urinae]
MKSRVEKIAFGIIFAVALFVLNAMFGNPASKALAERGANKVIAAKYGDLDLSREKVIYNLKDGDYVSFLKDKNSVDSAFELCFDSFGRLRRDTYDRRIDNTVERFDRAIQDYGRGLEKAYDFPYQITLSYWDKIDPAEDLTVDQPVDMKHLPFKLQAQIYGVGKDATAEEAMELLQTLQKIMDAENLDVVAYAINLVPEKDRDEEGEVQTWEDMFSVYEVPADVVRRGDVDALKALVKLQTTEGKD